MIFVPLPRLVGPTAKPPFSHSRRCLQQAFLARPYWGFAALHVLVSYCKHSFLPSLNERLVSLGKLAVYLPLE
jgi:hypothetical protein